MLTEPCRLSLATVVRRGMQSFDLSARAERSLFTPSRNVPSLLVKFAPFMKTIDFWVDRSLSKSNMMIDLNACRRANPWIVMKDNPQL